MQCKVSQLQSIRPLINIQQSLEDQLFVPIAPVGVLRLLELPPALPGPEVARVVAPVRARVHVHPDEVVLDRHRVRAPLKHAAPLRQRRDLVRPHL